MQIKKSSKLKQYSIYFCLALLFLLSFWLVKDSRSILSEPSGAKLMSSHCTKIDTLNTNKIMVTLH